jgi:hypothetical protein
MSLDMSLVRTKLLAATCAIRANRPIVRQRERSVDGVTWPCTAILIAGLFGVLQHREQPSRRILRSSLGDARYTRRGLLHRNAHRVTSVIMYVPAPPGAEFISSYA